MPHIKLAHRNNRIWTGLSVFLSGLVPMYHLSRSKIHTWDPAATHVYAHTNTHAQRLQVCSWLWRSTESNRGDCVLSLCLFIGNKIRDCVPSLDGRQEMEQKRDCKGKIDFIIC